MASNRFGFFGLSGIIPENFKECTQNCIWEVFFYDKPTDYYVQNISTGQGSLAGRQRQKKPLHM